MKQLKWVYYGVGAFLGFGCGTAINLIFYWLEQSGNHLISNLVRDFGLLGRFVAEMVNALPLFGAALGVVMVYFLFSRELEKNDDGSNDGSGS